MASPAEIARILPETLPEDFSEWDSEDSPAAPPLERDRSERSSAFGADSKPFVLSARPQIPQPQVAPAPKVHELRNKPSPSLPAAYSDRDALGARMRAINAALKNKELSPSHVRAAVCSTADACSPPARTGGDAADALRNSPSLLPSKASADEEAFFNQLRAIGNVLNTQETKGTHKAVQAHATEEVSFKPAPSNGAVHRRWPIKPIHVTATIDAADAVHTPMFQSDLADLGEGNQSRKKWINAAVIAASFLISVFLGVWFLGHGRPTAAKQSIEPQPVAAAPVSITKTRKPSPSGGGRHSSAAKSHTMTDGQPGTKAEDYLLPQADSQQVSVQLTSTPQVPQEIKVKDKEE